MNRTLLIVACFPLLLAAQSGTKAVPSKTQAKTVTAPKSQPKGNRLSAKLDRPTALAILQGDSEKIRIVRSSPQEWFKLCVQVGDQGKVPQWQYLSSKMNLEFLEKLATAGVLVKVQMPSVQYANACYIGGYLFEAIPGPFVDMRLAGQSNAVVYFSVGRLVFNSVTGILTEGSDIQVEVEASWTPSPVFSRLLEVASEMEKKYGDALSSDASSQEAFANRVWKRLFTALPTSAVPVRCYFKRYDDGWRVGDLTPDSEFLSCKTAYR